ncbi:HNH endonuclease [Methylovulum psychrotolerans]|uniref:HNH domain-containing protein n=1 Tax=Methylovulum psychrotolerans TaxID=1704499 RepID=A0A2S5CH34_9GAMM|nr:HNH endonuclease [Methylovulum psychrotolerans]POZ50052.1 hypothetical protein AADEFJLK_04176 [Methylovulum psychrotolerans]
MTLLFCNVGWMNNYDGIDGDSIVRGGAYNQHSVGSEVCNFTNIDGTVYGYVQLKGEQIRIERLGASKNDNSIDGITVVWLASSDSSGTVVIGWYKDATVYRYPQKIKSPTKLQKNNRLKFYRIKAQTDKALLLPVEQRELTIPRGVKGGIGRSHVWYADKEENKKTVNAVTNLIENGDKFYLPDIDGYLFGFEGNPRLAAHLRRERNAALVKAKKESTQKATGKLCCEVCEFDFSVTYGKYGEGFCEVHHLKKLAKSDGVVKTELQDLAVVCSNCHRIIHRTEPMLNIADLVNIVRPRRV